MKTRSFYQVNPKLFPSFIPFLWFLKLTLAQIFWVGLSIRFLSLIIELLFGSNIEFKTPEHDFDRVKNYSTTVSSLIRNSVTNANGFALRTQDRTFRFRKISLVLLDPVDVIKVLTALTRKSQPP